MKDENDKDTGKTADVCSVKKGVPTEKIFGDFLELLEADSKDQYTGFLFKFIEQVLASTMNLGKDGYAPVMNFTLYARQVGMKGGFEMIFRPSRTTAEDVYRELKLGEFGQNIMDAYEKYAIETWGMTPVTVSYTHLTLPTTPYV